MASLAFSLSLGLLASSALAAPEAAKAKDPGPAQKAKGWTSRLRSNSMNALFGLSDNTGGSADGHAWLDSQWRQFLKVSQVPQPSFTWLTLDEHPDGINDAFFVAGYNAGQWGDLPASYHNGACGFSFADGHAQSVKFQGDYVKRGIPGPCTGVDFQDLRMVQAWLPY